jgi:antitoxin MazE
MHMTRGSAMTVKVRIIRIGNSRGIRIPKAILEECRLEDAVELQAREGRLVVKPAGKARQGWEEVYHRMAEAKDDALLDEPFATDWDKTKWRW